MDREEWWNQGISNIDRLAIERSRLWREYVELNSDESLKAYRMSYSNWINAVDDNKTGN